MDVVYNNPGIEDDYSQEVIGKACELSPELNEYVMTQQYLRETTEDNLSPFWLRNKLICKLVEQLQDRGIVVGMDADDVCDAPQMVYAVLFLRSKFDQDKLYEFFKDHRDILDQVRELMDDNNCIEEIIDYCNHLLPMDEGWDALNRVAKDKPGIFGSEAAFGNMLEDVIDRIDRMGDPGVVDASNESMVLDYTGFLGHRKDQIAEVAKNIYGAKVSIESAGENQVETSEAKEVAVDGYMKGFEKELARASVIEKLSSDEKTLQLGDVRAKYLPHWRHALEYWTSDEHKTDVPTELDMAVMVATLFTDFGGGADARVKVIDRFESCMELWGNRYDTIRDLLDNALANLAMLQEVNNAQ